MTPDRLEALAREMLTGIIETSPTADEWSIEVSDALREYSAVVRVLGQLERKDTLLVQVWYGEWAAQTQGHFAGGPTPLAALLDLADRLEERDA